MSKRFMLALVAGAVLASAVTAQETRQSVIYVSPNPVGINKFLKLGADGTKRVAEKLGLEAKIYESSDPTTMRQNLEAAAREDAAVVVVIGFEFDDILPDIASRYPDARFLQIDSCPAEPPANVYCTVFREHEVSFLAGAEAALTSETGKIGAIGALDIPFIHRYTAAFVDGARHANPEIEVSPAIWIGGDNPFGDPARGQQRASVVFSDGADRVMTAAAGSNAGVFRAALDFPGAAAFGVDVNECNNVPGTVMDNVEKRIDVVVAASVEAIILGKREQVVAMGLADEGMTLTGLTPDVATSGCLIANYPDVISRLVQIRDEIIAGTIIVNDPMAAK